MSKGVGQNMCEALDMLLKLVEELEGHLDSEIAPAADLLLPLDFHDCKYHRVTIIKRLKSHSRPLLIQLEGSGVAAEYLLKREDVRCEWAAMGCLNLVNRCWEHAGCLGFAAKVYDIIPIGDAAGLVSVVQECTTLDRLKREADEQGRGREYRVTDFLKGDMFALEFLATSTAAYLASNYFLGVCDGHGDNVMLTRQGHLFRVDFGYVFGNSPTLPMLAISFDAPVVWLPEAVVVALLDAGYWESVLEASISLVQKLVEAPGEFWCRILAACDCMDHLWHLGSTAYVLSRSVQDFQNAVEGMRRSIMKQLKNMLHYGAGYAENHAAGPCSNSAMLAQGILNLLYQTFDSESSICVELVADRIHDRSEEVQIKAMLALAQMGEQGALHADKVLSLITDGTQVSVRVKRAVVQALTQMGENGATQATELVRLLSDDDSTVRKGAVHALGRLQVTGAAHVHKIAELLADADSSVRATAIVALARTGELGIIPVISVAQVLADHNPAVRVAALHALAQAQESNATHVQAVLHLLTDRHALVRSAAAYTLAKMRVGYASAVVDLLEDESGTVRSAAALTLSMMGADGSHYSPVIVQLLKDANDMVRCAAAIALMRMEKKVATHVEAVSALLTDRCSVVRSTALHVLGQSGNLPAVVSSRFLHVLAHKRSLSTETMHSELLTIAENTLACKKAAAIILEQDDLQIDMAGTASHANPSDILSDTQLDPASIAEDLNYDGGLVEEWSRQEALLL